MRDKVTRVQHLGALSMKGKLSQEEPHFEVIACIAGRGFKVRREDMKKLLIARVVLEKLAAMQMIDVELPTTDDRVVALSRYTEPEKDQLLLLRQLKLQLPAQPPPKITTRNSREAD